MSELCEQYDYKVYIKTRHLFWYMRTPVGVVEIQEGARGRWRWEFRNKHNGDLLALSSPGGWENGEDAKAALVCFLRRFTTGEIELEEIN